VHLNYKLAVYKQLLEKDLRRKINKMVNNTNKNESNNNDNIYGKRSFDNTTEL
jgi:hypothetical protein